MKKISFLFILLNLTLLAQNKIQYKWINPNPEPYLLYDIYFLNSTQGWSVGESSTAIKTTDGGLSWEQIDIPVQAQLQRVYFADENNGWILGGDPLGALDGAILKTTDGGRNWKNYQPNPQQAYAFLDISMVNKRVGYIAGFEGIFKTTNGGGNWVNTGGTGWATSVFFLDTLTGWATGVQKVLRTTDGAKTWNLIKEFHWTFTRRIKFINDKVGWVIGGGMYDQYGTIRKTTDGGNSWVLQDSIGGSGYYDMEIIDSLNVLVIGENGQMRYTTDGGNMWLSSVTNSSADNYGIAVINNNAWIVGGNHNDPKMLKGNLSFYSWQTQIKNITQNNLLSIDLTNETKGWAAGSNGELLFTTDGGNNWNQNELFDIEFQSISIPEDNAIFIAGLNGEFVSSFDGGKTWGVKNISLDAGNLHKIKFFNKNIGYWFSEWGPLMKTSNGGNVWDTIYAYANDFFFADSLNGWVYYEPVVIWKKNNTEEGYGNLRRTTDGGLTWSEEINTNSIHSMFFINSQVGWYTDWYSIYKTTDGGFNWDTVNSYTSYGINQMIFVDENEGYMIGSSIWENTGMVVLKTDDGGKTLAPIKEFTALNEIELTQKNIIGVGSYGQILKLNRTITDIKNEPKNVISDFSLLQNFPNPFNPSTKIRYSIKNKQFVLIQVYDLLGKEVATLVNEEKAPGNYEINFNANIYNLSSGVYFYRIRAGSFNQVRKMLLIK